MMVSGQQGLSVHVLGPFAIRRNNRSLNLGISGATKELLGYLATYCGTETRREYLLNTFWEDADYARGRSALNTALWRINRLLPNLNGLQLETSKTAVALRAAREVVIDAHRLEDVVRRAAAVRLEAAKLLPEALRTELADAVNAYSGPFLDGVSSTWAIVEREKYINLHLRGLHILMHEFGMRRWYEEALDVGRRILAADPFREAVQCEVMWLYVLNGQRAHALKLYRDYQEVLKRELDIRPMAETRALYEYIVSDVDASDLARSWQATPAGRAQERHAGGTWLNGLLSAIESSRQTVYDALRESRI